MRILYGLFQPLQLSAYSQNIILIRRQCIMIKLCENQTTMIGSMPHLKPDDAFNLMNRYPLSAPTWPQLPKRSFEESMTVQYSQGLPGVIIDKKNQRQWLERNQNLVDAMTVFFENVINKNIEAFAISEEFAQGWFFFQDYLKSQNHPLPLLKSQVTGPFTYGLSLNDNLGKAVWFDEEYRDIIVKQVTFKALWQIQNLQKFADNIIVFLDEPIFSALGTPAYIGIQDDVVINVLNEIADTIKEEYQNVALGVHCCGNMDWSLLAATSIDIIAFDAYVYGDKVALYPQAIKSFLEKGGYLAWGIVPTGNPDDIQRETYQSLKKKVDELIELYEKKGIPADLLNHGMIFTPSCGLGTVTSQNTEKVLQLLSQMTSY